MTMKHLLIAFVLASLHLGAGAQQPAATAAPAGAAAAADDTLYRALGGRASIDAFVGDFVQRLAADPRIGAQFKGVKLTHLAKQLADQFCMLAGGPCIYDGASMADAHSESKIRKADFHRAVELLQLSMDGQGVPFGVQNQLLALLAPMHREIINTR